MKKNNNKGFTLVELIVVLVILAILAAILVPALLGYIDRAREKQYVLNAKSALTASQAELSSVYGECTNGGAKTAIENRASVIKKTADTPENSKFTFYTGAALDDNTKPGSSTHLSFTIVGAVYIEDTTAASPVYMAFNGSSWVGYDDEAAAIAAAKTKGVTEIKAYDKDTN